MGDARQLSPSAQEALRLRAVAALVEGRGREDVAVVFKQSTYGPKEQGRAAREFFTRTKTVYLRSSGGPTP